MSYRVIEHAGQDVLPWFQPVSETLPEPGTRLHSYSDYRTAPNGTKARLGRKNGKGHLLLKSGDAWSRADGAEGTNWTAYGMEGQVSYVEL